MDTSGLKRSQLLSIGFAMAATCCNILSTSGVYWSTITDHNNVTHVRGLFSACANGRCYLIPDPDPSMVLWQNCMITSCVLSFIASLLLILNLVNEHTKYQALIVFFVLFFFSFSLCAFVLAVYAKIERANGNLMNVGWSYAFAWINECFLVFSLVAVCSPSLR